MTQLNLKEGIKGYYETYNLTPAQITQMEQTQNQYPSQMNRLGKTHTYWAIATCAIVLIFGFSLFNSTTGNRRHILELVDEIAINHNRNLEMEIKSNSLKEVASYLSRLDFPVIQSVRLPEDKWDLIGGRYCSVKRQFAAQLKLRNKVSQNICTLYQFEKPSGVKEVDHFSEHFAKGVKVNLWLERGMIFALAGDVI